MSASRLYEINSVTRICSCYGQTINKLGASKKRGKPFKLSIENVLQVSITGTTFFRKFIGENPQRHDFRH